MHFGFRQAPRIVIATTIIVIVAVTAPAAATADNLLPIPLYPTYHRVVGVAANDVLNVRRQPSTQSEVVGSFAPDAQPIEVIDIKDNWGRVIIGEGNGWVSLQFLEAIKLAAIGDSQTPVATRCSGTEPFWSIEFSEAGTATFSSFFDGATDTFQITAAGGVSARPTMDFIWLQRDTRHANAFISREYCSDGMSDRLYGQRIGLTISENGEFTGYAGCCWVPPPVD